MKKTLLLCKISVFYAFGSPFALSGKPLGARIKKICLTVSVLALGFVLCAAIWRFAADLTETLALVNREMLVPVLAYAACFAVITAVTVFSAHGHLFDSRDLDMLLSLPLTPLSVMLSKCAVVYVFNLIYSSVCLLPTGIAYLNCTGASFGGLFALAVSVVTAPLLPTVIGISFSFAVNRVPVDPKFKSLVTVAVSIVALCAFFAAVLNLGGVSGYLAENGGGILDTIGKRFFPAYLFGASLDGSVYYTAVLTAVGITFALAVLPLLSLKYAESVTRSKINGKKAKTGKKIIASRLPVTAVFRKELSALILKPMYIMNTLSSVGLAVVFSAVLSITGTEKVFSLLAGVTDGGAAVLPFLALMLSSFAALSSTTCCSLSLEGRNFWILKTAPISASAVLYGKILVNIVTAVPAVAVCSAVLSLRFGLSFAEASILLLLPSFAAVYAAFSGMLINLLNPRMDFANDTAAVKHNISTFFSLVSGAAFVSVGIGVYFLLDGVGFLTVGGVIITIEVIAVAVLAYILKTWGTRRYEKL